METTLTIELAPIGSVVRNPHNARTHSKAQVRQIADSIREFGFVNPVLVDEANRLIAGHGRLAAARLLGMGEVPVIRLAHLTEHQKRALALADNKIALNSRWDPQLLAETLIELSAGDLEFDVSVIGFAPAEIDLAIEEAGRVAADPRADNVPTPPESSCVVRGDLWQLEEHRLLCGDATNRKDFRALMGKDRARLVFTDPPYNVRIEGNVSGLGRLRHGEFPMASGEMSEAAFIAFLDAAVTNLVGWSVDGSIHYICMDWRHIGELLAAARGVYGELKNLCVWNKTNAGMGSLYRSKHELVLVFKNGTKRHINNVELGRHGRHRTNVWDYAGASALHGDRAEQLAMHPTVKPVTMVADALKDCSHRGALVLDCFAGSGTILIAAERTGRRACAMELDPRYVETAIRRWEEYTGETALHVQTGLTLEALRRARRPGPNLHSDRFKEDHDVG